MIRKRINNNKIMLTVGLVLFLCFMVLGGMKLVKADKRIEYKKSFKSIEVMSGDTLTSIASKYAISEADYEDYIEEVKNINNLKSDTIHAGCYLMIPIYQMSYNNLAMQN